MSFDLMVFEKAKAPKDFENFMLWYSVETKWEEARDYNSLNGTSPNLSAWFTEMRSTFPAMNGEYALSDDEAFANEDIEQHLTDYSLGSSVIYAAFAWSLAGKARELAANLAQKYDVGFFDPQSGEICCTGMALCKTRTEITDDKVVLWEQAEKEILSLDIPERDGAFITIWFEQNGTDAEFMQCAPNYVESKKTLKTLFSNLKNPPKEISSYTIEAGTGTKIYTITVSSKEQVASILHDYYFTRKLPDLASWADS